MSHANAYITFVAFALGCLLVINVRAINKFWCSSRRRRVFSPYLREGSNRSDHYVTSIIGGITPPRIVQQCPVPVQLGGDTDLEMIFCKKLGLKYCRNVKRTHW